MTPLVARRGEVFVSRAPARRERPGIAVCPCRVGRRPDTMPPETVDHLGRGAWPGPRHACGRANDDDASFCQACGAALAGASAAAPSAPADAANAASQPAPAAVGEAAQSPAGVPQPPVTPTASPPTIPAAYAAAQTAPPRPPTPPPAGPADGGPGRGGHSRVWIVAIVVAVLVVIVAAASAVVLPGYRQRDRWRISNAVGRAHRCRLTRPRARELPRRGGRTEGRPPRRDLREGHRHAHQPLQRSADLADRILAGRRLARVRRGDLQAK